MKLKTTIFALTLSALSLSIESYGQDRPLMTKDEHERMDSLDVLAKKEEVQLQKVKDEQTLTDAKNSKEQTEADAKEAKRIGEEANDAALQSKNAYQAEKKAQKARRKADKQAEKAAKAKNKSDKN